MNLSNLARNAEMLTGRLSKQGYMRWWHSFSGTNLETGEQRSFFIEFLIMNPGLGSNKPILGQHPFYKKKGMKPSYVCIKAGVFPSAAGNDGMQLHRFYPISELQTTPSPLVMQVGNCFYSEERLIGSVNVPFDVSKRRALMTDCGSMQWDLEVHKAISCSTGFLASRFLQALNALDSFWHAEGVKSLFSGTVTVNGVDYDINPDTCNGYADKHWGRSFNRPWIQLASNNLVSAKSGVTMKNATLAVNGCCPRFLFIPLRRKLLLQLTYKGEEFNYGFRPFLLSGCKWETRENGKRFIWHISARNAETSIKISGSCTKAEMLKIRYENPDGTKSPLPLLAGGCGVGRIDVYRRHKDGKELIDTLHMSDMYCEYRPDDSNMAMKQ